MHFRGVVGDEPKAAEFHQCVGYCDKHVNPIIKMDATSKIKGLNNQVDEKVGYEY